MFCGSRDANVDQPANQPTKESVNYRSLLLSSRKLYACRHFCFESSLCYSIALRGLKLHDNTTVLNHMPLKYFGYYIGSCSRCVCTVYFANTNKLKTSRINGVSFDEDNILDCDCGDG